MIIRYGEKNVRAKMRIKIIVGCGNHYGGIQIIDAFPITICSMDYFIMLKHRNDLVYKIGR